MIWLEILLGFGVPVAWGVYELLGLRRERRKDERRRRETEAAHAD